MENPEHEFNLSSVVYNIYCTIYAITGDDSIGAVKGVVMRENVRSIERVYTEDQDGSTKSKINLLTGAVVYTMMVIRRKVIIALYYRRLATRRKHFVIVS